MSDDAFTRENMKPEARRFLSLPMGELRRRNHRMGCVASTARKVGLFSGLVGIAYEWTEPDATLFSGYWVVAIVALIFAGVICEKLAEQIAQARMVLANERMERLWASGWRRDPDGEIRGFPSLATRSNRD